MAMKRIGANVESWLAVDFDKYAIQAYNTIHNTDIKPIDICEISGGDIGIVEKDKYCYLMTYSFPCLVGNSLVLTKDGFKEIQNITKNDFVLSHDNQYHKVIASKMTGTHDVLTIKGMGIDEIVCTKNHKFYVRRLHYFNTRKNGMPFYGRRFDAPEWMEAEQLSKNYYMGIAINQNEIIPKWDGIDFIWKDGRKPRHTNELGKFMNNHDFWWLMGAFVGDGWSRYGGGIIICGNDKKVQDIRFHADKMGVKYNITKERTVTKVHFPKKEWGKFVEPFKKGASNKCIPGFVIDLPIDLLKSFLDGYMNADGNFSRGKYRASSVSKELIYGIGQIVAKVYKRPYSIYAEKKRPIGIIEGRKTHNKHQWQIIWKTEKGKQDKAFYENGYVWFPIKSVESSGIDNVYDIEVETSHSFTVNGVITHNCTDLSLAGKQHGMKRDSGTRSSLIWEVERILKECKELSEKDTAYGMPDVLVMENVTEVHGYKNKAHFDEWIKFLESLGYTNYMQDLNAADYGVAQHRERCFLVSLHGDYNYKFPTPIPLDTVMADYLEDEVPDKYYIKSKKAYDLIVKLQDDGTLPVEEADNDSIQKMGFIEKGSVEHQSNQVFGKDGQSPTIPAVVGDKAYLNIVE